MEHIGKPVKRFDFDAKVEGRAKYCSDIHFENRLYAKTLRSEISRAKITSIIIPEMPEGYFIVDHRDVQGNNIVPSVYNDQPFFAEGEVKFIGEPILLVMGPDRQKAQNILKSIQ